MSHVLNEIGKTNDYKLLLDLLEVAYKCEPFEEFYKSERCEVNTQGACAASCFFVAVQSVDTKNFSSAVKSIKRMAELTDTTLLPQGPGTKRSRLFIKEDMSVNGNKTYLGLDFFNAMGLLLDVRVCAVSMVDERKSNNGHVWALADTQVRWLGSSSSDKVMSVIHISNGHYQPLGSGVRVGDRPRTTVFRAHHAMSTEELSRAIVNKVSASMQSTVRMAYNYASLFRLPVFESALHDETAGEEKVANLVNETAMEEKANVVKTPDKAAGEKEVANQVGAGGNPSYLQAAEKPAGGGKPPGGGKPAGSVKPDAPAAAASEVTVYAKGRNLLVIGNRKMKPSDLYGVFSGLGLPNVFTSYTPLMIVTSGASCRSPLRPTTSFSAASTTRPLPLKI